MRRILTILTIFAFLIVPQISFSDDLDDFKAAVAIGDKLSYSLDPKDMDAYINLMDEEAVYFDPDIPFPIVLTKEIVKQSKLAEIEKLEFKSWIQGNIIYRIVGDTGTVSKFGTEFIKPKGAPEIMNNVRVTIVYTKIKGKWLICAAHFSRIPFGK